MTAAIQASLESSGPVDSRKAHDEPTKELGTEEEQMSKALEESLAMSSSKTLERDGRFNHPVPSRRVRNSEKYAVVTFMIVKGSISYRGCSVRSDLSNATIHVFFRSPVGLRVQNPHLVFLPAVLVAMYAAKPFRDRILAFKPPTLPTIQPLVDHDVEGLWKGESSWRTEESWGDKTHPIESQLCRFHPSSIILLGIWRRDD